jgi:hypothetical protein
MVAGQIAPDELPAHAHATRCNPNIDGGTLERAPIGTARFTAMTRQ